MKRTAWIVAIVLSCVPAFGIYEVGDTPKNYCWKDITDTQVCLDDAAINGNIRVLLYNAGWCGPCNTEFATIAAETKEFANKAVTFISLSASGWTTSAPPNKKFLEEWRSKHKLETADAHFIIAGSHRDAGKDFFDTVFIPNVVILNGLGEVVYKAINPGVAKIAAEVRKVLPRPVPFPPAVN